MTPRPVTSLAKGFKPGLSVAVHLGKHTFERPRYLVNSPVIPTPPGFLSPPYMPPPEFQKLKGSCKTALL